MDNPVQKTRTEEQIDWIDELYDIVKVQRDKIRLLELRLRKVERKIAEEIDFELLDDEGHDED